MEPEDLKTSISVCRNPHLAQIFYRLKLIEAYGTGLETIRETYSDSSFIPEFRTSPNSFTAVLPFRTENTSYTEISGQKPVRKEKRKLSADEEKAVELAIQSGFLTRRILQEHLNLTKSAAVNLLNKLVQMNYLKKTGNGRSVRYVPFEDESSI